MHGPAGSLSTWWAVRRSLGSWRSMRLTRSLAEGEMRGHGSDWKSTAPRSTASKMPCSVSGSTQAHTRVRRGGPKLITKSGPKVQPLFEVTRTLTMSTQVHTLLSSNM